MLTWGADESPDANRDEYYHDDPIEKNSARPGKRSLSVLAALVLIFAGFQFVQTTLASNISLNSGSVLQFGQGIAMTSACSGNAILTVTPTSTFTNVSGGAGTFYFNSVTVSGIPSTCNGSDFTINAFGNSGDSALAIFKTSSTDAVIYDNSGTFTGGVGTADQSISSATGTFTLTFSAPVASSTSVYKLTIQSGAHVPQPCWETLTCAVGATGAGGGTIFYASTPAFTESNSPCSSNCHYLEWAPAGWSKDSSVSTLGLNGSATTDPTLVWSKSGVASTAFGYSFSGYSNTATIIASYGAVSASNLFAAGAAHAYQGNSKTDWFLPSGDEAILMGTYWSSLSSGEKSSRFGTQATGGYWTSTEATNNIPCGTPTWRACGATSNAFEFGLGNSPNFDGLNRISYGVRPIRAF
jgi:hypothetical protein